MTDVIPDFIHHDSTDDMIEEQKENDRQFGHKPIFQRKVVHEKNHSKKYCKDTGRPGDTIPEPFSHNSELSLEDIFFGFIFFRCLCVINSETDNIEKSGKPSDDKYDMKGLCV